MFLPASDGAGAERWQVDWLGSESDSTRPDVQRVYEVVVKMLDRWNAHDIEGHLEMYWEWDLLQIGASAYFRIYLTFHVRGHRDERPVALDSLRHPDSRHGSPSLTASSALSPPLVC